MRLISESRLVFPAAVLALLAACTHPPQSTLALLAAKLPSNAVVLAGADLDHLRATPLLSRLPDAFRNGSYVLAAYTGNDLVTATRTASDVELSGTAGTGAPADLLQRVPDAPVWLVARGSATLPLTGNLANLNRLLSQTQYTVLSALPTADHVEFRAEGICAAESSANHLEENIRAIASLTRFPLEVVRDGAVVRVRAVLSPDAFGRLFGRP